MNPTLHVTRSPTSHTLHSGEGFYPHLKIQTGSNQKSKKNLLTLLSSGSKITDSVQVVHTLLSIVEEWGGEIWLHL